MVVAAVVKDLGDLGLASGGDWHVTCMRNLGYH